MRLKEYLAEAYLTTYKDAMWMGEKGPMIYINPTATELKELRKDEYWKDEVRFISPNSKKSLIVWAGETEIHEDMCAWLAKKGYISKGWLPNTFDSFTWAVSGILGGYAEITADGKLKMNQIYLTHPDLKWGYLKKYFTNWPKFEKEFAKSRKKYEEVKKNMKADAKADRDYRAETRDDWDD